MARVPESLLAPWLRGNDRFHQLLDVLELCTHGIGRMPHFVKAAEEWDNQLRKLDVKVNNSGLGYLQSLASKAEKESSLGFPTLHAHVVVSLWSIAENTVEDFMVEWVKYDSKFLERDTIPRAKISIADLLVLDEDERIRYMLAEIQKHLGCAGARGIEKFERLLSLWDLCGGVEDSLRKDLIELCEIRNVIVHRGSVVDRKLLRACPWIGLKPGELVALDAATCKRYIQAFDSYMGNAMMRLVKKFEESPVSQTS